MIAFNLHFACGHATGRHTARGFTLIELIIVIVIISVVAVVGLDRLFYWQERAEQAAMNSTLASFKMGLQIRSAEMAIAGSQGDGAVLERENPVRWLKDPPPNYAGDYRTPAAPGNWYFAPAAAELIYVPNSSRYLQLPKGAPLELRFKVRLKYDDIETSAGKGRIPAGIRIVAVSDYKWF